MALAFFKAAVPARWAFTTWSTVLGSAGWDFVRSAGSVAIKAETCGDAVGLWFGCR